MCITACHNHRAAQTLSQRALTGLHEAAPGSPLAWRPRHGRGGEARPALSLAEASAKLLHPPQTAHPPMPLAAQGAAHNSESRNQNQRWPLRTNSARVPDGRSPRAYQKSKRSIDSPPPDAASNASQQGSQ